jgi:hypothetical protein
VAIALDSVRCFRRTSSLNPATIEMMIPVLPLKSVTLIDGEFLRPKEFNEVKLNADIRDSLEDAHLSF